uniref:coiled-coil domain-containing protein n=1 Tax=Prevotella sp. TaxID=59823 RepID=UPI00402599D6
MIYSVANPIYDCVFKFLMEDERIAKTVLSALLKKEVVSVEMRRHEHPNVTRDKISMFRIDFAAQVKEDDGTVRLILIELQKTWVDTETLRFRRYLAAQYNTEENMVKEGELKGYAVPMIAVYLLGHRVGDIDKAVVYVTHNAFDYDGKVVEGGMQDPFINSLIHDSIIVQIPLLHGKINNRLDRVLSVFDQSQRDAKNQQIVCLDEKEYAGDSDMMYILHRLGLAAMDADVRQEMNDEDEFYSVLEARDTQVMKLNEQIMEKKKQLNEQKAQLNEQKAQLNEQKAQLNEKQAQLNEKTVRLAEAEAQLKEQKSQVEAMVKAMVGNGMTIEAVAKMMNKSEDEINDLL